MPNEPASRTSPNSGKPIPGIMWITLADPPPNETVGTQFTAIGKYNCDQTTTPTFTCSRTKPDGTSVDALYVTYSADGYNSYTGHWEAYFNDPTTGASTVTATISHQGSQGVPASNSVTVSSDQDLGLTVTAPKEGDSIPSGTYPVSGTCATQYNNSNYQINCSVTSNGYTVGQAVAATVNSRTGSWSADLPIDAGLTGDPTANINVVIVRTGQTTPICERAVGKLTITSS
jgi:hypothetical protein